jgi:hypothetical protein
MSRLFSALAILGMCGSFALAQSNGPTLTPIPPSVQAPGTGNNPTPMPDTMKPSPLLNPAQNQPNEQKTHNKSDGTASQNPDSGSTMGATQPNGQSNKPQTPPANPPQK